jgi:alkanesulfonate monooxygenase SsuD/methylene tetrahydromethanopterin reductase-like flavin-dependent oxidoreductase (luciferase family)
MQIGLFGPVPYYGPQVPRGFPLAPRHYDPTHGMRSMERGMRMFELADDLGLDCVTVSEHHFAPNQLTPEPNIFAAAMTQRVRNAKISILGVLLPMVDPVRVAEQFAMLDTLCNGRLLPGVFRGTPNELMVYHSNPSESRARYEEAVQLLLKCWTEPEPFGWEGRYYRYRSIAVWPRPVQQPTPPLLITGNSPHACRFAGTHHLDMGLSLGDVQAKANHIAHYKAAAQQAGWTPTPDNLVTRYVVHVAATDQKAREEFAGHMHEEPPDPRRTAHFRALWAAGLGLAAPPPPSPTAGLSAGPGMFPSLIGSPDTLLPIVQEFVEATGVGRLELIFSGIRLPPELSEASLRLFAKEMLPTLHELDARPFLDRIELAPAASEEASYV